MMNQQQQQKQFQENLQMGSGLTRYRSAPSSYFASHLDNMNGRFGADDFEQLFNPRATSPETQRIFSMFMNSGDHIQEICSSSITLQSQPQLQSSSQFSPIKKIEPDLPQQLQRQQSDKYSSVSPMMYQTQNSEAVSSALDSSYNRVGDSLNSNGVADVKKAGAEAGARAVGGNSSLLRHSSSPAGFLASLNMENEIGAMRGGIGNFGGDNSKPDTEATFSSASNRFMKSQMGPSPSSGQFDDDIQGFPLNSWDDSSIMSDNFIRGLSDNGKKRFSNSNASDGHQNNEGRPRLTTQLSHHLSLPKSAGGDLSAMELLLQDSVPCRIRAKRGCATHPRSIAERVRRTKISERMRRLQELVPNMDKQTNTSDMLDLAVDYIKDLQRQVKMLSDNRAKCSCLAVPRS